MLRRVVLSATLFLALCIPTLAQVGGDAPPPIDSTEAVDSTGSQIDSTGAPIYEVDTTDSFPVGVDENQSIEHPFFTRRSGIYAGATVELTNLMARSLDPVLDGDMLIYGGEGYLMAQGWIFGGGGWGAVLYDLSPRYDQFSFGYGGLLLGYDQGLAHGSFSIRPAALLGVGGLTMIKKRPDIVDSTGHEILERYRDESFFCVRPGISLGFQPNPYVDLRVSVDYLMPIGGARVSDLRALTYGVQLIVGLGQ